MRAEHSHVTLAKAITSGDDSVPVGAEGCIVHIYKEAAAYEVEFYTPVHVVATVTPDELVEDLKVPHPVGSKVWCWWPSPDAPAELTVKSVSIYIDSQRTTVNYTYEEWSKKRPVGGWTNVIFDTYEQAIAYRDVWIKIAREQWTK